MTRHPTDFLSLLAGLAFVIIGALALTDGLAWDVDASWIVAIALVVVGVGAIVGARRPGADDASTETIDPDDHAD